MKAWSSWDREADPVDPSENPLLIYAQLTEEDRPITHINAQAEISYINQGQVYTKSITLEDDGRGGEEKKL